MTYYNYQIPEIFLLFGKSFQFLWKIFKPLLKTVLQDFKTFPQSGKSSKQLKLRNKVEIFTPGVSTTSSLKWA